MSLNESIVEDAGVEWFGELGYAIGHGPHLAPGEQASRDGGSDPVGEVELVGRLRGAVRRPAAAELAVPQSCNLATLRDTLLLMVLSGELSLKNRETTAAE